METHTHDNRPLYMQLHDSIRDDILNGTYRPGEKILTEEQLSKKYGVSRITVRNALETLARDNYLVRKRGAGTFISEQKFSRSISEDLSFTDMCKRLGVSPGSKTIKSVIEDADSLDQEILHLNKNSSVVVIERIRYANALPISVESTRFTTDFTYLLDEDLNNQSLYKLLREKYRIDFFHSNKVVELSFATYQLAKYLDIQKGYPLLNMESQMYLDSAVPFARNSQFIRGDKFKMYV